MIKGAIFDFDGTLFDSMQIWNTVGSDYLHSLGFSTKEDLQYKLKTMSLYQSACYMKNEYNISLSVKEIINGIIKIVEQAYYQTILPKPGVVDFLKQLKAQNVKMCIATATEKKLIESALSRCGITSYFDEIFTCGDVAHSKNDPHIYRVALDYLGTSRNKTVIFEDALHAITTAKSDGFVTVGVFDSNENRQKEIERISDLYMTDFEDLNLFWEFASKL